MSPVQSVSFFGHPHFEISQARDSIFANFESATHLAGEFAVASQSGPTTSLFCAGAGTTQLFYATRNSQIFFADTVSDVVKAAGLDWQWDYAALTDMAVFGHLIGNRTLHREVRRVGKREFVSWNGSSLQSKRLPAEVFNAPHPADDAIESLLDYIRRQNAASDSISFSAGFDSRVILAAFLSLGLKPNLVVMGSEQSTDVLIATRIATALKLPIEKIPLTGTKALAHRSLISRVTSGTKTVENWHTFEYTLSAGSPSGSGIWIGSNGEYARTFFVDRGIQFYLANALGQPAVSKFWRTKINRNSLPPGLRPALRPEFLEAANPQRVLERLGAQFPEQSLGEVNDELYLERVRQFIANGLRLVSTKYVPKTPFLDPRWISSVKQMPRRWKMGNRWHRYAISRLYPELLKLPYDASGVPMGDAPGIRYWLGRAAHSHNIPYFDYPAFFKSNAFLDPYRNSIKTLKGICRGDDAGALLQEWPMRTTTYFSALAFYTEMLSEEAENYPTEASLR